MAERSVVMSAPHPLVHSQQCCGTVARSGPADPQTSPRRGSPLGLSDVPSHDFISYSSTTTSSSAFESCKPHNTLGHSQAEAVSPNPFNDVSTRRIASMTTQDQAEGRLSLLHRTDGSATFSFGGYTIIASVNGPIEAQRREENPFEAVLDVVVRPAAGVGGTQKIYSPGTHPVFCRKESVTKRQITDMLVVCFQVRGSVNWRLCCRLLCGSWFLCRDGPGVSSKSHSRSHRTRRMIT